MKIEAMHNKPGGPWTRIGNIDSAGRRSLWLRMEPPPPEGTSNPPAWFELCAGREGDDAYYRAEMPATEPGRQQYLALLECLTYTPEAE